MRVVEDITGPHTFSLYAMVGSAQGFQDVFWPGDLATLPEPVHHFVEALTGKDEYDEHITSVQFGLTEGGTVQRVDVAYVNLSASELDDLINLARRQLGILLGAPHTEGQAHSWSSAALLWLQSEPPPRGDDAA